jgi:hypothetical protein
MVKKHLLLVLLFCLPFLLFAETILLYTMTESAVDDLEQFNDLIESGVMNEFFDAGHIVFNAAVSSLVPDVGLDHYKEPASIQMAKAGGAAYLLEVILIYNEVEGRELPSYAEFQLIDVATGNLLKEGSVSIDKKWIDEGDFENGITAMGRSMASYALSFL